MSNNDEQRTVEIFDTTLRDGEQSPGASLNPAEKMEVARQLERLNVDVIEAGFPIASEGDFEAVHNIAEEIRGPTIAGLARSRDPDIERCAEAVEPAENGRIHVFIATSDVHVEQKLEKSKQEVLDIAVESVEKAKSYVDDVEFSPEDAARTKPDFLKEIVEAVIDAGATTVNIPDTVGYAVPEVFGDIIRDLREDVPNIDEATISVHCHNDLGLATANSLAAAQQGAGQIEVAVNGIGERAGNAALEEVVMALRTREDVYDLDVNVDTTEISRTSRLVSSLTGISIQRNKAIVGENAFAHESGIHQHGVLKDRLTYEIMKPEDIGLNDNQLVLGKHSGRHAFKDRLDELGYELEEAAFEEAFERFKKLADKKKEVYDGDIEAIVEEQVSRIPTVYELDYIHIVSGNTLLPTATLKITIEDETIQCAASGDGPVDAIYSAINEAVGLEPELNDYGIRSVTRGQDALGEVTVKLTINDVTVNGRGTSTDVLEASARAYLDALNRARYRGETEDREEITGTV
jgi:2-isopropylmalate synthase